MENYGVRYALASAKLCFWSAGASSKCATYTSLALEAAGVFLAAWCRLLRPVFRDERADSWTDLRVMSGLEEIICSYMSLFPKTAAVAFS